MSKAASIIVLCEDKIHNLFVRGFLKKGWKVGVPGNREIRTVPFPSKGNGSAKQHVEKRFISEVDSIRLKHTPPKILIVVIDADEKKVSSIKSNLGEQLKKQRYPRNKKEPIAYIVPKWHIETWIAYLDGKKIDESDKSTYKNKYGKIKTCEEIHPYVEKLATHCKKHIKLESPPESLVHACKEFDRIRGALVKSS